MHQLKVKQPRRTETRERILDAGERLFSERGLDGAPVRAIAAEAGVRLSMVTYYFPFKDSLISAVIERRVGPLNRRRLALLDRYETQAGPAAVPLEKILEATVGPVLRLGRERGGSTAFKQIMGRLYVEPGDLIPRLLQEQMSEIVRRFGAALQRALPDLPPVELFWRLHFAIGALAHTMAGTYHLEVMSNGHCDPSDVQGTIDRLVAFLAAGFRAPLRSNERGEDR